VMREGVSEGELEIRLRGLQYTGRAGKDGQRKVWFDPRVQM